MKTQIKVGQETKEFDLPIMESSFYEEISKYITTLTPPTKVEITCELGNIEYDLIKRSGTMFIREESNTIVFPNNDTYKKVYLVCINEEYNNYKFYQLEDTGTQILATYGRIGANKGEMYGERTFAYDKSMYWIKYNEKIAKGYKDLSHVYLDTSKEEVSNNSSKKIQKVSKKVSNKAKTVSQSFYEVLLQFAKNNVEKSCVASVSSNLTQKMVTRSKELFTLLENANDLVEFNTHLKELFMVAPRKINKVERLLAKSSNDFMEILNREESLILSMEVLVNDKKESTSLRIKEVKVINDFKKSTKVKLATDKQREEVIGQLSKELQDKVATVYRVYDKEEKQRYQTYCKERNISNHKLLWHGSRNENWLSIISTGLLLKPNAHITGKMFGHGIYFAPSSKKSWGYTSAHGSYWARGNSNKAFMGLYKTAYGTPQNTYYASDYTEQQLINNQKNCVHAKRGPHLCNDEIIYYNENAMMLEYIVEFHA